MFHSLALCFTWQALCCTPFVYICWGSINNRGPFWNGLDWFKLSGRF